MKRFHFTVLIMVTALLLPCKKNIAVADDLRIPGNSSCNATKEARVAVGGLCNF